MKKNEDSRILFIIHLPPPITGAGVVGNIIKNSLFVNTNFETEYIDLATSKNLDDIGKRKISKIIKTLSIILKVFKALFLNKVELCYMSLTSTGLGLYKDVLVIVLLKLFGKKIVYHFHNKGIRESGRKWYNHILYKFIFNKAYCILLSPLLIYDIEHYVNKERVFFCANGIPEINPSSVPTNLMFDKSKFQLLFLSNMMYEKGVLELLEACSLLKKEDFDFKCNFVGAWANISEKEFNYHVQQFGLEQQVVYHGKKFGEEKNNFFKKADLFVFPTFYHFECFPLVLLEAMQFGLPIISTREGAIPEIVAEGKTGFLIPQKDGKALAEAVAKLINNIPLAEQMGACARQRYEKLYSLNSFEKKLSMNLQKIINA